MCKLLLIHIVSALVCLSEEYNTNTCVDEKWKPDKQCVGVPKFRAKNIQYIQEKCIQGLETDPHCKNSQITSFLGGFQYDIKGKSGCGLLNLDTLYCGEVVPEMVEDTVKTVYFTDIGEVFQHPTCHFCDETWESVLSMSIYQTKSDGTIPNNTFTSLDNLEHLTIEWRRGIKLDTHSFNGLPSLKSLVLLNCYYLLFPNVLQALKSQSILPQLSHLSVEGISTYQPFILKLELTAEAMQILSTKHITELNLSGVKSLTIDLSKPTQLCNTLKFLNLSLTSYSLNLGPQVTCPSLRGLDLSSATTFIAKPINKVIFLPNFAYTFKDKEDDYFYQNITHLYLANILRFTKSEYHVLSYNCKVDSSVPLSVTTLNLAGNHLKRVDVSVNADIQLEEIDLSENEMEYLGKKTLDSFSLYMKRVVLSNNMLYKMESEAFEILFQDLKSLTILNLSSNRLQTIPNATFINNKKLEILDLSNNRLSHIVFNTSSLTNLKMLNLGGNLILDLGTEFINSLQTLFDQQAQLNQTEILSVHLYDNPLSCDCKALPFVTWVATSDIFRGVSEPSHYTCLYEYEDEPSPIDPKMVEAVQYLCEAPIRQRNYIISLSVAVILTATVMTIGIFQCAQKIKQKRKDQIFENCVKLVLHDQMQFRFLVFMSFCSTDGLFVMKNAFPQLTTSLMTLTQSRRKLICTGADLQTGRPILEEITKFMDDSAVFVAVVSRDFCESFWCKQEILKARLDGKPVILLFKEHVEYEEMGPHVQYFFKRNIRSQWRVNDNGEYELETSWKTVGESIIQFLNEARE